MAFTVDTSASLGGFFDDIISFLTSNGWTVIDTISTYDKVIRSYGTDSRKYMIFRLTASTEAGYPVRMPNRGERVFPSIIIRGYQHWASGVGYNEYGTIGPRIVSSIAGSESSWRIGDPRYETSLLPDGADQIYITTAGGHQADSLPVLHGTNQFDPSGVAIAKLIGSGQNFAMLRDLRSWKNREFVSPLASSNYGSTTGCLTFNSTTGNTNWFFLSASSTLTDQWWRLQVESGLVTRLAAPLWSAVASSGSASVWDGNDTIYVLRGNGTTAFAKYTISTNTWANLTVSPVTRSASLTSNNNMVYVPAAISGFAEDVIYTILTAGTTIYRYNVTSNTWGSDLTCPFTIVNGTGLQSDGGNYLYVWNDNVNGACYHSNLAVNPNAFSQNSIVTGSGWTSTGRGLMYQHTGWLRANNSSLFSYTILADADRFVISTQVGGRNFFVTCGEYKTYYPESTAVLTQSASAGSTVALTVDDTTGLIPNQRVTIFDIQSGKTQLTEILSVDSSTAITVSGLSQSYGVGAILGSDAHRYVITNSGGYATCMLASSVYRPSGYPAAYYAYPRDMGAVDTFAGSTRLLGNLFNELVPLMPIEIYNPEGGAARGPSTVSNSTLIPIPTLQNRGSLINVYAFPNTNFPAPQPGSIITTLTGRFYVIGSPFPMSLIGGSYSLAVGPI